MGVNLGRLSKFEPERGGRSDWKADWRSTKDCSRAYEDHDLTWLHKVDNDGANGAIASQEL